METEARRVLVIPGAGASRELGRDGELMPMMDGWATSLRDAIDATYPAASDVIGLRPGIPGDEFETNLGQFLAFQKNLGLVAQMARLGALPTTANQASPQFGEWHTNAVNRCAGIIEIIRGNLFENFGKDHIDDTAAEQAYNGLVGTIRRIAGPSEFAFATTNYDPALELAFESTIDGFVSRKGATPVLDPVRLSEQAWQEGGPIPVLHLHGAVGWYTEGTGRIVRQYFDQPYNNTHGTPALLLPDSSKTPDSFVGGEQLWAEFKQLLNDCTHVLFLGHSLNDKHLAALVQEANKPTAVTWYSGDLDRSSPEYETAKKKAAVQARSRIRRARIVPAAFGPEPDFHEAPLSQWLEETA